MEEEAEGTAGSALQPGIFILLKMSGQKLCCSSFRISGYILIVCCEEGYF